MAGLDKDGFDFDKDGFEKAGRATGTEVVDVAVLGGGPGGYVAAIRAAQLGAKVCVVEEDELGGTCLNRGCIPTKAMAASAALVDAFARGAELGVTADGVSVDFGRVQAHKAEVVGRLVKGIHQLFKKHSIRLLKGRGRLLSPHELVVEASSAADGPIEVQFRSLIVATGSSPSVPPVFGYDGSVILTSDEALELTTVPKGLVVIGGGVIGCEFATIFSELGSAVTVVEVLPGILSLLDADVSRQMQGFLKKRGIEVLTNQKVVRVDKTAGDAAASVVLESGRTLEADVVLISVGRRANTADIGLEAAGVAVDSRGEIPVDERQRTSVPHVYAVGDATATPFKLAHVASRQGIVAAENILGHDAVMDYGAVPSVVFTLPEAAGVGLTEAQAREKGLAIKTAKFFFLGNGKALAAAESEGFAKLVALADTGRLVGGHIISAAASSLVAEIALAIRLGATAKQVAETIHAHPTLPEAVMEAAEGIYGQTIHA